MEYSTKERAQSKVVFEVKNDKDEIEKTKVEAYSKLLKDVRVPGFRKGKTPYEVGVAFIGEDSLLKETLKILVDRVLLEVLEKENIVPLEEPDVEVDEFSKSGFKYKFTVEFLPQVSVDIDKKIEVPVDISATEEEINAKLHELQDSFTEIVPTDKTIENGDIVEVSYSMNSKQVKSLTIEAGKEKVVGDFSEQILGKKKGDKFAAHIEQKVIDFTIVDVKERNVPAIDDDLAKEAGFDDFAALKTKIVHEIKENKKLQAEEEKGRTALRMLAEGLSVEFPQKYLKNDTDSRMKDISENYLKRGYKLEEIVKQEGKSVEDLRKEVQARVEKDLKEDLVLREIINKKEVKVADDEIKAEFEHVVETELNGKRIPFTDELRRYIKQEILRSKAISLLKENVIILFGGD